MKNYLILLLILNLFVFIWIFFVPINLFIKGIIIGGISILLVFQYIIIKNK